MNEIQNKKNEILNSFFKSKDGLSWNEATEMLNDLIKLSSYDRGLNERIDEVIKYDFEK